MPVRVRVEGLETLQRRLAIRPEKQAQWKAVFEDVLVKGMRRAERRAPRAGQWRLKPAITSTIDTAAMPMGGRVEAARVTGFGGFPYGFALNVSKKYHYRGGPAGRRGKLTFGWFRGVQKGLRGLLNRHLRKLARADWPFK